MAAAAAAKVLMSACVVVDFLIENENWICQLSLFLCLERREMVMSLGRGGEMRGVGTVYEIYYYYIRDIKFFLL
jgi:hypothetical protein